jgi:hypothetical protein
MSELGDSMAGTTISYPGEIRKPSRGRTFLARTVQECVPKM